MMRQLAAPLAGSLRDPRWSGLPSALASIGCRHRNVMHLAYRPSPGDERKHTFERKYFESPACRAMQKVVTGATVASDEHGIHVAVASRALTAGEVIETGVLRASWAGRSYYALHDGIDFNTGSQYDPSQKDAPKAYLASGYAMFYRRAQTGYNTELMLVPSSQPRAWEFEVRAVTDIPQGTPLVRCTHACSAGLDAIEHRYGDIYHMSEDAVTAYLKERRRLDLEIAAQAGVEPEEIHEETLREHLALTRTGKLPLIGGDGGGPNPAVVVLPHPSWSGFGAFATRAIKKNEVVEWGLQRQVDVDGLTNPYVFTWNPEGKRRPKDNIWATGSGAIMFYNSDHPSNVRLYRLFHAFRHVAVAKRDIELGEELMHLYASSSWRSVFIKDETLPKLLPVDHGASN